MSKIIKKVVNTAKKLVKKVVKTVVKVVKSVVNTVVGTVKAITGMGTPKVDVPDFEAAGSQGILINKQGSSVALPVIYGTTRTGGAQVFIKTSGTDNSNLDIVFAICEGEIDAIQKVYFDGAEVASTTGSGSKDPSNFTMVSPYTTSNSQIYFRPGTDSQTAIGQLAGLESGWNPRFQGVAYVYIRLVYDSEVWKNGMPTITFDVKGKKVPATSDGTTLGYSDNPARCILDYLTNSRYGKGIAVADIDLPSFQSAETYFTSKSFHCRGNLDTNVKLYDNMIDLFSCCASYLTFGNKYRILPEKAESTIQMTLDDSNTIGDVVYFLGDKANMLNRVKIKFMDEATEYRDNIKILESSTLKTNDNDLTLESEIFLPFTKTLSVAQQLGTEILNQTRQSHTISLTATIAAVNLQVGDLVQVTNSTFNITNKQFRVRETTLLPSSEVELLLQEYDADVYGSSIITDYKDDNND